MRANYDCMLFSIYILYAMRMQCLVFRQTVQNISGVIKEKLSKLTGMCEFVCRNLEKVKLRNRNTYKLHVNLKFLILCFVLQLSLL